MLYQSIPYHSPGVGVNILSNALLSYHTDRLRHNYKITTGNFPLTHDPRVSNYWDLESNGHGEMIKTSIEDVQ